MLRRRIPALAVAIAAVLVVPAHAGAAPKPDSPRLAVRQSQPLQTHCARVSARHRLRRARHR
jgi:hypothetical protein